MPLKFYIKGERVLRVEVILHNIAGWLHSFRTGHRVRAMRGEPESAYGRVTYNLKKLRGKELVRKIGNSRRYDPFPKAYAP